MQQSIMQQPCGPRQPSLHAVQPAAVYGVKTKPFVHRTTKADRPVRSRFRLGTLIKATDTEIVIKADEVSKPCSGLVRIRFSLPGAALCQQQCVTVISSLCTPDTDTNYVQLQVLRHQAQPETAG